MDAYDRWLESFQKELKQRRLRPLETNAIEFGRTVWETAILDYKIKKLKEKTP